MKKEASFIIGIFLVLVVSGCVQQPKKLTKVNIAFQSWVGYGPFYLGQEKGFFKDEGIDLIFVDEQSDGGRRDAFKAGMLDCEAGTIDLLVSKKSQDTPIVAVLEIDRSFGGDAVVVNKEIKNLEDLIGKKIVFSRDNVGEAFIAYLFYKNGLSLKDITIVSCSPEDVASSFLNEDAVAVVTWEPWVSKALSKPGAYILISSKEAPGIIIDTLNVREQLVKNNPELVKALMRAWFRSVGYYKKHPEEANRIIAKYFNISPEAYSRSVNSLRWTEYKEQINFGKSGKWQEAFDIITKIKFENGRITKKPEANSSINTMLIQQIYENSQ
ncbi:MAG: ABC transporter substrate-binding protein [Candidatus Omnitrophica bacterium]|nr:ABC transporter substrate-binding protein [Candidatus Omnitrophota bacterium]